jgi:hypothetical protein
MSARSADLIGTPVRSITAVVSEVRAIDVSGSIMVIAAIAPIARGPVAIKRAIGKVDIVFGTRVAVRIAERKKRLN